MTKYRFFKNLYQVISFSLVIFVFVFILLIGFFASLNYDSNNGWYLLLIALALVILFFIIGFYWIFQIVEIDEKGIKIKVFARIIRDINWDSITEIKYTSIMRNPAYVLLITNERNLNLDSRKSIKTAINHYAPKAIKDQLTKI